MLSGYEDKTEFVECEFRVFVTCGQRKVPVTSDMSAVVENTDATGYLKKSSYNLRENPW
jgi:hypothetical protein